MLQVAPNGPERSDDTTLFFAAAVDGCEQGMLPSSLWLSSLPEWKAFANPSDGSEGYGKEISKPRWGLGFHSPKQLICGDLRFSSSPNGGDYKPIQMSTCPLIEDKSQEGGTVC